MYIYIQNASSDLQVWIPTSSHHFTEIGQIFHNKYIFSNKHKLSKLTSGKWF